MVWPIMRRGRENSLRGNHTPPTRGSRTRPSQFLRGQELRRLRDHPLGRIFYAPLDVLFSRFDVVEPDLLYVSNDRAPDLLSGQYVTGAPDLVIEIGSPSTRNRDETIKRRLYERSHVTEYWVIDPEIDVIRVYRRKGEAFARPVELSAEANDILTSALLPGLEIPLSHVFED